MRTAASWFMALAMPIIMAGGSVPALAQSSDIGFQAKLTGVPDGPHTMTFSLYDVQTGGTPLQTVGPLNVAVQEDVVSTTLPFDKTHWNGQPRWIGYAIDGGSASMQRTQVLSVPAAARAYLGGDLEDPFTVMDKVQVGPERQDQPPEVYNNDFAFLGNRPRGTTTLWGDSQQVQCTFFPLLSNGSPFGGFGIAEGPHRIAPIIWMYANAGNLLDVRTVPYGTSARSGQSRFSVHSDGAVVVGTNTTEGSFYVNGRAYLGNTEFFQTPGQSDLVLKVNGRTQTKVLTITGGADLAEPFDAAPAHLEGHDSVDPAPGMVMTIDRDVDGRLRPATQPYDIAVAGVISGANGLAPGMLMGKDSDPLASGEHPLAMTGRVWVFADASFAPIRRGDRLTTSSTPGHVMRATDPVKADGAVIGKAMTQLAEGRGYVMVLVNLQ